MESSGYTVISIRESGSEKIQDRVAIYDPRKDAIDSVSSVVVDKIRTIREGFTK